MGRYGPLAWSAGSLPYSRRVMHAVRNNALLPGPNHIWRTAICAADVCSWPYSAGFLVMLVTLLV